MGGIVFGNEPFDHWLNWESLEILSKVEKEKISEQFRLVDQKFEQLEAKFDRRFEQVDKRFDRLTIIMM